MGPIQSDLRGRGDVSEKRKRKIVYPDQRHLEMSNDEDDYPSIASMISLEEAIYQKDQDAVTVVFERAGC